METVNDLVYRIGIIEKEIEQTYREIRADPDHPFVDGERARIEGMTFALDVMKGKR